MTIMDKALHKYKRQECLDGIEALNLHKFMSQAVLDEVMGSGAMNTFSVENTPNVRGLAVAFVQQRQLVGDGCQMQFMHRHRNLIVDVFVLWKCGGQF